MRAIQRSDRPLLSTTSAILILVFSCILSTARTGSSSVSITTAPRLKTRPAGLTSPALKRGNAPLLFRFPRTLATATSSARPASRTTRVKKGQPTEPSRDLAQRPHPHALAIRAYRLSFHCGTTDTVSANGTASGSTRWRSKTSSRVTQKKKKKKNDFLLIVGHRIIARTAPM